MTMEVQNRKITEEAFEAERQTVLTQWPTGAEVDPQEALRYQEAIPQAKRFAPAMAKAKKEHRTLIQPRAGVPVIAEHIKLMQYLQDNGEADLLPTTIDSYTRLNRYEEAEVGIRESLNQGKAMLNGFPAVNHGVQGCRMVTERVRVPIQVRHGTPDARLLAEITLAGGFTSYEGGGISYNIPYAKNVSLEKTIRDWMYVDRLVGWYQERGITINREPFGPLTGTLVPPCVSHAVAVIEALLAAEQGVKSLSVGYGQLGNLVQDVAAIRTLEELTDEYMKKYGHEAVGVPTMEANAQGLRCTKQVITMLCDQYLPESLLAPEMEIIKAETRCILDKCFELGEGDIAVGAVRAFQAGVIDVPFAPSRFNAGKIMPARDNDGAVRMLNIAGLPFTDDLKAFHQEKIAQRAKAEKRAVSFQMVIDDIYAISKGRLVGRPRG